MTRRIGFLHLPACRRTSAAAQQLDPPTRSPHSGPPPIPSPACGGGNGRGLRRQRSDPPSGHRRIRQIAFAHCLPAVAPAPQQKGGNAGALRGELQPAARDRRERSDFADHRGDAGSAQPLLHRPQDLAIARCPNQHEARGIEPMGGEAGPVEIRARKTPQNRALPHSRQSPENAGGKGGSERTVLLVAPYPEDLVQGPLREPATRQYPVDLIYAERQDPMDRQRRSLDPPDALAQLWKAGSLLDHVLFSFSFLLLSTASRAYRVIPPCRGCI